MMMIILMMINNACVCVCVCQVQEACLLALSSVVEAAKTKGRESSQFSAQTFTECVILPTLSSAGGRCGFLSVGGASII